MDDGTALVDEVRAQLAAGPPAVEKRMFGGLAFLVHGYLAVSVRGRHLLVRVHPDDAPALLTRPHVAVPVMGRREMTGWLEVDTEGLDEDATGEWVRRGVSFVGTLPPRV